MQTVGTEWLWSSFPLNAAPSRGATCLTAWCTKAEQYNRFLTRPEEEWVQCWWMLPKYHSCQWCRAEDDEGQRGNRWMRRKGERKKKEEGSGKRCGTIRRRPLIWNKDKILKRRWRCGKQEDEDLVFDSEKRWRWEGQRNREQVGPGGAALLCCPLLVGL